MKKFLLSMINMCLFLVISYIGSASDESELQNYVYSWGRNYSNNEVFLDTNKLVDTRDFMKILRSKGRLENWFNDKFATLLIDTNYTQINQNRYCNIGAICYKVILINNQNNAPDYLYLYILKNQKGSEYKYKLLSTNSPDFYHFLFEEDEDVIEEEVDKLLDVDFDFDKYLMDQPKLNVSEYLAPTNGDTLKNNTFNNFQQQLKEHGGKLKGVVSFLAKISKEAALFPHLSATIKIGDKRYNIEFEKRNCSCCKKPEYYLCRISREVFI